MADKLDYTYLAERYMDMVFRIALCQLKNRADSEDVTQNVMLRLLRQDGNFQSEEHAKRWLIRVTVNETKRLASSLGRHFALALEDYEAVLTTDDTGERELLEAVMALPPKYRIVIHLQYFEGYTSSEIGKLLGISQSAVTTRLMRARDKLKIALTQGGTV